MPIRQTTAANLHLEIEGALAHRFPGALSPRPKGAQDRVPLGIDALDELLQGGFPLGCLSEVVGPPCSGRTTIATSLLARVTAQESAAAWVDAANTFDPGNAAECGVDLRRLLWVRCQQQADAAAAQATMPSTGRAQAGPTQQMSKAGGSPHPRSEADGMPAAIAAMLTKYPTASAIPDKRGRRIIGTPGAPNRPLVPFPASSPYREEQVGTDRVASRREEEFKKTEERMRLKELGTEPERVSAGAGRPRPDSRVRVAREQPRRERWNNLDKALRVTDLLLQAGGFRLLVLDLGSVAPEMALRIPLSTWFRFRAACERTRTTMVLLTQHTCANSSADMLVRLQAGDAQIDGQVLTGLRYVAEVERTRKGTAGLSAPQLLRKPPQSDRSAGKQTHRRWETQATWAVPR